MIQVGGLEVPGQRRPVAAHGLWPKDPLGQPGFLRPKDADGHRWPAGRCGGRHPLAVRRREASEGATRRIPPQHDVPVTFLERSALLVRGRDLDLVALVEQGAPQADGPRVRSRGVPDEDDRPTPGHVIAGGGSISPSDDTRPVYAFAASGQL